MHRNTFLCGPSVLNPDYSMKNNRNIFFAGQITGVEGYVESAVSGLMAGINGYCRLAGSEGFFMSKSTVTGALSDYVANGPSENFQPMNANFGIVSHEFGKIRKKKERYAAIAEAAIKETLRVKGERTELF